MNRLSLSIVELEEVPAPSVMGDRVLAGTLVLIIGRIIITAA